ncbi:MAG: DUF3047 domain-containing protein [Nitrospiraceae bacterium]|nr:MAG: DUF3047 domain-containing protein [Nitrospiraceae bacterium]
MRAYAALAYALAVILFLAVSAFTQDGGLLLREDFNDLENWKPLYFPKIDRHTTYTIEKDGENSYLKAESNASASGIVFKKEFNVFEYPVVQWRWNVSNVFEKGNAKEKSGDDYPLRIYIIFKYNPDTASFGKKVKYGIVKAIYGEYPPHSSLNYIWANRGHAEKIITNTYASEAQMIVLETGSEKAGMWIDEKVNILEDYRRAFGADPPAEASLAIMSDSDNTGEQATSFIDYIEVGR